MTLSDKPLFRGHSIFKVLTGPMSDIEPGIRLRIGLSGPSLT